MKYIIMCGGTYGDNPKHLLEIRGECIVERTIKLLRRCGVEDIAISTNSDKFEWLGVPILKHRNEFVYGKKNNHSWLQAFYPTTEPVTYIFGDVYFFKVRDPELFFKKVEECHRYDLEGKFKREAVSWELWQVIKGTPLNQIRFNYTAIRDYSCDVDNEKEARELEEILGGIET